MTATNEATDEAFGGTPIDGRAQPVAGRDGTSAEHPEGVAAAAARDVARLLDRRGIRDIVALAHRVLRESTRLATTAGPRSEDGDTDRCTLRQHERPTRRDPAGRAVDDDRA